MNTDLNKHDTLIEGYKPVYTKSERTAIVADAMKAWRDGSLSALDMPAHVSLAMVEDQIERKVATFKPGRKETGLISNLTMLNALRRWHQYKSEVQA